MSLQAVSTPRFVRKTQLGPNEYRKNFHQIDREVMALISSAEADHITPLMSKIYLRLVNAPERFWEREGVLRIEAQARDEKLLKAWTVLCNLVGVASATASKALSWMHEQGIIGYFSGKNGVGLRIFLNRAVSSIGMRQAPAGKKFLTFPPASFDVAPASLNEPAFKDSYAVKETSDTDINPRAPKNGAEKSMSVQTSSIKSLKVTDDARMFASQPGREVTPLAQDAPGITNLEEIVRRLKAELEPSLQTAVALAAEHEHARTREWLDKHGIPKATRVAQREAYNVLRQRGAINAPAQRAHSKMDVGNSQYEPPDLKPLSPDEMKELAEICITMLETQDQAIDVTLAELGTEAGGYLTPQDAPKVRAMAQSMAQTARREE